MSQKLESINQWLLKYIGLEMTPKLQEEITTKVFEQKHKTLGYKPFMSEVSLVYVTDKNSKIIRSIGASDPNDLIVNNFGQIFKGFIGAVANPRTSGIYQTVLTGRLCRTYGGVTAFLTMLWMLNGASAGATGSKVQIGSGITPPARTNINIETPFGIAPENARNNFLVDSVINFGLARITNTRTIGATGAGGTVNETCLFMVANGTSGGAEDCLIFRDAISPPAIFALGQNVTVSYTIQL